MRRKRRDNRPRCTVQPKRLDQYVFVAAYAQDSTDWRNWRGRSVTMRNAQALKASGDVEELTRKAESGLVIIFREKRPVRASEPTPAAITFDTMEAVSNATSSSYRPGTKERAEVDKFLRWPLESDRKAVTVQPRLTERERCRADQALERARGQRPRQRESGTHRRSEIRTLHPVSTEASHVA